jgi:nitrous oxidase accessory protein NosD
MRRAFLVFAFAATAPTAGAQLSVPRSGLVISRTTALRPGTYRLAAKATMDSGGALIIVRGNDVTLDLTGVHLIGASESEHPDRAAGVAILVDGGANVTIKGGHIRGYKVAILARGTRTLRLLDNDLSFNWKPRLYSIIEHESLADWLSFHHNEKDEWLRYGAAIYLSDVRGGELRGNTVHQGMNGLLMTRTDSVLIWNNDFSFNSGLGVGMYRSSHNRVMHNRFEFNVRGYSEGFYRRGQDSAGILIYEQSDSNVVAYNSATHGGDGLFLWAGQHTMDTGEGGANDNVFLKNDFSWAPTNGMEATFSRNRFLENRVVGSDYGLWGGYSYNSEIIGNHFERNRVGIAIEHGQENFILGNKFLNDSTDIALWANKIEPSDWGYPKHRDTQSRDYLIGRNTLKGARVALRVADTRNVTFFNNLVAADSLMVTADTSNFRASANSSSDAAVLTRALEIPITVPPQTQTKITDLFGRPDGIQAVPGPYANWPRSTIIVDDWGPYDWKSPKLWPADSSLSTPLKLRVLGHSRDKRWRLLHARGARVSKQSGRIGDTIVVTPALTAVEDWTVKLEHDGRAFAYSRFDARPSWDVKVYAWNDTTHPLKAAAQFDALVRGQQGVPVLTLAASRLDYVWYRPRISGWPQERVGVAATTTITLPGGSYMLRTISDDGIRVFVDDKLVIDDWTVHESAVHEAPLAPGRHRLRVEYFQLDGWTELRAEVVKRD